MIRQEKTNTALSALAIVGLLLVKPARVSARGDEDADAFIGRLRGAVASNICPSSMQLFKMYEFNDRCGHLPDCGTMQCDGARSVCDNEKDKINREMSVYNTFIRKCAANKSISGRHLPAGKVPVENSGTSVEPSPTASPKPLPDRRPSTTKPGGFEPVPPPSNKPLPGFQEVNAGRHLPSRQTPGATPLASAIDCVTQVENAMTTTFKNTCDKRVAFFYCFKGPTKRDASCNEPDDWAAEEIKANGSTWVGRYELQGNGTLHKGGYVFVACELPKELKNWAGFRAFNGSDTFNCGFEDPEGGDEKLAQRYLKKKGEANARAALDNRAIEVRQAAEVKAARDLAERRRQREQDDENAAQAAELLGAIAKGVIDARRGTGGSSGPTSGEAPRRPCASRNVERC